MVSPSRLNPSSVTKKVAFAHPVVNPSEQPTASIGPELRHRPLTTATRSPDSNATVEALREDPNSMTPPARVLPEHVLPSEDNDNDESDSAYSSFSATHAFADVSNNSDSTSSAVKATKTKGLPAHPKAKGPKKVTGKRLRAESNASSASADGAAAMPAKKRVRSNTLMRSAPRATSITTPGGLAGNPEFMYVLLFSVANRYEDSKLKTDRNFTATIFIIQLGPDGPQFHAHESVLKRSPKLNEEVEKAKGRKRASKQNTLALMAHDAIAFEQMLQFLYKDKFLLSKNKHTPAERLGEFKELMSLAKHYVLPNLQKQIVKLFSSSKILYKIPPSHFFDWAEDMYYEEIDHENGPFKVYLSRIAPTLMKTADEGTMKQMARMVNQGGGFAEQLFVAATNVSPPLYQNGLILGLFILFLQALNTQNHLTAVKKEEQVEGSTPVRHHGTKGAEKEPVPQIAHEEATDTHEDESMGDSEGLFGKSGPLTTIDCPPDTDLSYS